MCDTVSRGLSVSPVRFVGLCPFDLNSTEQSLCCTANNSSASQECPCCLWIFEFHYRVYISLPLFPIVSQMNPVYTLSSYFRNIFSNIITIYAQKRPKMAVPIVFHVVSSGCTCSGVLITRFCQPTQRTEGILYLKLAQSGSFYMPSALLSSERQGD